MRKAEREVAREVEQLLRVIFRDRRNRGRVDLEAIEMAVRSALHRAGAAALSELLPWEPPAADRRSLPCACGHTASDKELRPKPVMTVVGPVRLSRPYYLCAHCHQGQFPADGELDGEGTEFSPGVRRMLARVGHQAPCNHGPEQIELLAGWEGTTQAVERTAEAIGEDIAAGEQQEIQRAMQLDLPIAVGAPIPIRYVQMDATGVPVVKKETAGRSGKTEGPPVTQTKWDPQGYPLRDPDSTTSVGAIEPCEEFGKRIYLEAWKRGWSRAVKKVVRGDGAEGIGNLAQVYFPGAIQIVDLFHARQHRWDLARQLYPGQEAERKAWIQIHQDQLDGGKIEELVQSLRSRDSSAPELAKKILTEAAYFESNSERMRYPKFRSQHLFVGTGVMEAGCKTVIGSRLKQSGMFWTVRGANAILALRCCHFNARFESYWEARVAA